jgi:hypothetical protein
MHPLGVLDLQPFTEMGELDECHVATEVIVGDNGISGVILRLQGVFVEFVPSLVRGLGSPNPNLCFDCLEQMTVVAAFAPYLGRHFGEPGGGYEAELLSHQCLVSIGAAAPRWLLCAKATAS